MKPISNRITDLIEPDLHFPRLFHGVVTEPGMSDTDQRLRTVLCRFPLSWTIPNPVAMHCTQDPGTVTMDPGK
jgi:hypothetical protein